ncbi:hypothetical protein C2845_PM06G26110 [Panicum miliaceum]|uniref:Uncharacterized protein n=1 Tax=Panicum miliaceum TaxID=4540 RepID=A0A3L6R808_PANMI|nr:hypothetical protein C2845_PM06G26110 [Panicum miliaceum]
MTQTKPIGARKGRMGDRRAPYQVASSWRRPAPAAARARCAGVGAGGVGRRRVAGAAHPERRPPTRISSSSSSPPPLRRQGLRADRADGIRALLHADPPPPPSAARAYGRIHHMRRRRLLLRRPASIHHALAPPSATPAAPCVHPRRPRLLLRLALVSSCGSPSSPLAASSDLSWAARIAISSMCEAPCGQEPSPC